MWSKVQIKYFNPSAVFHLRKQNWTRHSLEFLELCEGLFIHCEGQKAQVQDTLSNHWPFQLSQQHGFHLRVSKRSTPLLISHHRRLQGSAFDQLVTQTCSGENINVPLSGTALSGGECCRLKTEHQYSVQAERKGCYFEVFFGICWHIFLQQEKKNPPPLDSIETNRILILFFCYFLFFFFFAFKKSPFQSGWGRAFDSDQVSADCFSDDRLKQSESEARNR